MTWTAPLPEAADTQGTGAEREQLEEWLDQHRSTLLWKCSGLTAEQLKEAANPPSVLNLLGLVRHLTDCERWWFSYQGAGLPFVPVYCTDADPNADFDGVPDADPALDLERFWSEVSASKAATAGLGLDAPVTTHSGRHVTLRWVFLHMIEEYARHNGHADFLREWIDGATGDFQHRASS
ncbi:DinB family protein [Angustibacter sp. McL0619]|uniref:DinB family protein n=1 Tax=Angustibacter sp. McL0619 TaxID=3415676 RepID=UPI003CEFD300